MWKAKPYNKEIEKELLENGKGKLLARLLSQRNIPLEKIDSFLSASYEELSHPHDLKGIKEGVEIFTNVALNKGKVVVFGDYDVDGIFSSFMLKELCTIFHLKCKAFLPSRFEHGYGLNEKSLKAFKEFIKDDMPELVIFTDCGSNNNDEMKEIKDAGVDKIIIIDHHLVDENKISKSADVLINWHLTEGHDEMCSCGLVYQFIRGIRWVTKKVDPIEFLTYAAVGTVADVSPLIGNNRIIVKEGLKKYAISHVASYGFHALIKECRIYSDNIFQNDVAFKIAPRVNSTGRMATPDIAYRLLLEETQSTAELIAMELTDLNKNRKKEQQKIVDEAVKMIEEDPDAYKYGIFVFKEDWNVGIIGIVASKLVDTFSKPVLIMGENEGIIKGSGRSFKGINLKEILDDCSYMFIKYGGHPLAAGATLNSDYVLKANDIFNETCKEYYSKNDIKIDEEKHYDADLKISSINPKITKALINTLYPYCSQYNPEPIFKVSNVVLSEVELREEPTYKLLSFRVEKDGKKNDMKMKTFVVKYGTEISGSTADVYFAFNQDNVKELRVVDIELKK